MKDRPDWVLFNEHVITSRSFIRYKLIGMSIGMSGFQKKFNSFLLSMCTPVRLRWLIRAGGEYFDLKNFPEGSAKVQLQEVFLAQIIWSDKQ